MAVFLLLLMLSGQQLLAKAKGNDVVTFTSKSLQVLKSNVVAVDKLTETTNCIITQTSQSHQISSVVMLFYFDFYTVGQSTANARIKLPVATLSTPENKNTTRLATFNIHSDTHIIVPIVYSNTLENKSNNTNTFNN